MKTALRVNADLTTEVLDLTNDEYDQLSRAVDGWIQAVNLNPNLTIWCNEEGKLNGLPVNIAGTAVWEEYFGRTDVIVGNVVFTGTPDENGDTLPLADFQVAQLQKIVASVRELTQ
jgi:hypothetical protein